MTQNSIDPSKFAIKGINPFGLGWVMPSDLATNEPVFKVVVHMPKEDVEQLIALLVRLVKVDLKNLQAGWKQALEDTTGDELNLTDDESVDSIMEMHMGLPVKSPI